MVWYGMAWYVYCQSTFVYYHIDVIVLPYLFMLCTTVFCVLPCCTPVSFREYASSPHTHTFPAAPLPPRPASLLAATLAPPPPRTPPDASLRSSGLERGQVLVKDIAWFKTKYGLQVRPTSLMSSCGFRVVWGSGD